MAGELGSVGVAAATPVAGVEAVATRAESSPLPLPAGAPPSPLPVSGIRAEISTAAQLLSTLLNHPALANLEAAAAGPLMKAATPQAQAIAEALRNGITLSGLFYESHQAEWVAGTRALADLRREPQAAPASDDGRTDAGVPALVRQQLDMLDGQPLQWRGELWPGLPLQLAIQRDTDARHPQKEDEAAADPAAEAGWQGQIISTLPSLGRITARLRLAGEHLQLELVSAEHGSSTRIAEAALTLHDSLRAAGLTLDSFTSRHDERAR